ncbi:restriction endonuclease [Bacillus sp. FJAT-29814]|uniref:restriction endonuclease n=1 Tax=Bacillus sp. FJAT-29814 TaxID=1729688 RepID=UPI000831579F|nr:restriction endonuclease [Bacillus sp. FJAT-29814]
MAYYYRRNSGYKKKSKGSSLPSRKLQMYCPKHGELVGYANSYEIVIYESLNVQKNKVELKCFKCLEEETKVAQEHYSTEYAKADKQSLKTYGRKAKFLEVTGIILYNGGFFGYFYFWYLWGWLEALVPSGFIIALGVITALQGESLQKKYLEYRKELTKDLHFVSNARTFVDDESRIIFNWRMEQARIKEERMDYSFEEIDKMTGIQFEEFVENLLKKSGYTNVETTKASGDEGVDIIAYRNGKKIAIQCKRYKAKISNSAVQQVYSGKSFYDCHEAYVITNSQFTENAVTLARKLKVKLIDRERLFDMVEQVSDNIQQGKTEYQAEFKFDSL